MATVSTQLEVASDGDTGVGRVIETAVDEQTGVAVGRVVETVVDKNTGVVAQRERVIAAVPDGRGNILLATVQDQVSAVKMVSNWLPAFCFHCNAVFIYQPGAVGRASEKCNDNTKLATCSLHCHSAWFSYRNIMIAAYKK